MTAELPLLRRSFNDAILCPIAAGTALARLPALLEVGLVHCKDVTADGISALVTTAPALQRVSIEGCDLDGGAIDLCRRDAAAAGKRVEIFDDWRGFAAVHNFERMVAGQRCTMVLGLGVVISTNVKLAGLFEWKRQM